MAKKKLNVKVDTINGLYKPEGTIKQLDSVFFNIEVTEEGEKKDLTGQTIKLFARKSDGKMVEQSSGISITNAEQGELTIDLLNAAVQAPGYVYFELEISDSNGIISTADFVYKVMPKVGSDEAIESTNEVSTLKEIEVYVAQAKQEIKEFKKLQSEMLKTNENININEESRIEAEYSRSAAENERVEAEKIRAEKLEQFENKINDQISKIKKRIPTKNVISNSFEWEGYKLKVVDVGQIVGIGSINSKYFNKQEIDLTNHNRGVAYFDCSEPEPLKIKLLENFLEATEEFYNNPNVAIVGFRDYGRKFCDYLTNSEILSSKFIVHDNAFYIKDEKVCVNNNAFIIGGGSNWIKIPENNTGYTLNIADVLVVNIASGVPVVENWTWNNIVGKQNYNINSYKSTCIPIAYKDNNGKIHLVTKNDGDIEKIIADITEMKNQISEITSGKTNWTNKKIVWFGTSIPAGKNGESYPMEIGKLLKANVVNEAWGSSPVRCGQRSKVSHEDPRGWFGLAWQNVAFALSGTLEEKNEIINNWDYWKNKFSNTPPNILTEEMKGYIRDCSFENRLMRHLGSGRRADLYVFDHGFNDFLDGSDLETVPHDIKDRKTFIGAMNFLIDIILKDNPRARIILIGHYENQFRPLVASAQTKIAESWSLPIYKQWEKLGWSSHKINTTGYWDNGNWIESGGSPTDRKIKDIWLADGVHPYSDKSGRATNHIIKNMLPFFFNLN